VRLIVLHSGVGTETGNVPEQGAERHIGTWEGGSDGRLKENTYRKFNDSKIFGGG
jgi:hypothetical protein